MKKGDLVVLEWLDAVGPVDLDEGEVLKPIRAWTCGWVWERTPYYVTLAPEKFERGDVRAATTIPEGMIVSARVLEEA